MAVVVAALSVTAMSFNSKTNASDGHLCMTSDASQPASEVSLNAWIAAIQNIFGNGRISLMRHTIKKQMWMRTETLAGRKYALFGNHFHSPLP